MKFENTSTEPMYNSSLSLLELAEHDYKLYFVYSISTGRVVYINPAFTLFFKKTIDEVNPDELLAMVHVEDRDYLKQSYESMLPGEVKHHMEFRIWLPERTECVLRLSLFLNDRDDGEQTVTGYMEDITAYVAHAKNLNEINNKKNSILNILSHDLAGPLGSIKNFAVLLSRKTKQFENDDINKFIEAIERNSRKCILMIQEFIKVEFIESAGIDLVKKRCDLVENVERIIKEYQQSENELNKIFIFHTSSPQIYAEVDENKFMQAINNLISNSLKFTADGGSITLSLEERENTVLLTVSDTGIGIPQKFHATIFDKFNHARREGLKGEPSVGLGMSIIKTIVEWHQGKITFKSEENIGTTFFIEIPTSK